MFLRRFLFVVLPMILLLAAGREASPQLRVAPLLPAHELAAPPWRQAPAPAAAREEVPAPPLPDAHYDNANPERRLLQSGADGQHGLPRDARERVDWVRALRGGFIAPRAERERSGAQAILDLDIVMTGTREMPYVRFPHRAHTEWLACSNCHDAIFLPRAGANEVSMDKIFRGQACGVCHGSVAFPAHETCERCHNVVEPNGRRWW